jgi:hypothetical protein
MSLESWLETVFDGLLLERLIDARSLRIEMDGSAVVVQTVQFGSVVTHYLGSCELAAAFHQWFVLYSVSHG